MSRRIALLVLAGALVLVVLAMTRDSVSPAPVCPWDPSCAVGYEESDDG